MLRSALGICTAARNPHSQSAHNSAFVFYLPCKQDMYCFFNKIHLYGWMKYRFAVWNMASPCEMSADVGGFHFNETEGFRFHPKHGWGFHMCRKANISPWKCSCHFKSVSAFFDGIILPVKLYLLIRFSDISPIYCNPTGVDSVNKNNSWQNRKYMVIWYAYYI